MKNVLIVVLVLAALGMSFAVSRAQGQAASVNGRYAMVVDDAEGRNYLLDTQTGDSWVMHRMQRKGRFIGVWVPNYKVNNFDDEERIVNTSTNRQDILPLPPGVLQPYQQIIRPVYLNQK